MNGPSKAQRPTLVSFSGIDGAGKSTQIEALCQCLRKIGMKVELIRFWDDIARLKFLRESAGHILFKGDKGVGTPDAPITRKDKNVRSWGMTCIRMILYFVDVVSTRDAVRRALGSDADLIIFDRYCYDELANLNLRNRMLRIYARLILKITPVLNRSYLLDADPFEARARKPEYPIDFVHLNRAAYLKMSSLSNRITVIAPMGRDEVEQAILQYTLDDLEYSAYPRKNGGCASKSMA
jgi:thymidylate kinase